MDLFSPDRVIPRLRARDKRDALRQLAIHISYDAELPAHTVIEAVMQCDEDPAFGPGSGVSLPHAFVPGLPRPMAVLAKLDPQVNFDATDGFPTDLVVLLLSPAESAGGHLSALACIARRLREAGVRELLRASKCGDSMYVILIGSECDSQFSTEASSASLSGCDNDTGLVTGTA